MKTSNLAILFLSISLFSFRSEAACNTGAIIMKHESGFGISFGGGGSKTSTNDSTSINIPLTINGEQACFRKKTKFVLKAEDGADKEKGKVTISPMKTEFENVPSPSTKQYIFVEKNEDRTKTKFHTMSFVCSGELPLSIEASSNTYNKIVADSLIAADMNVSMVFATGAAAQNINASKKISANSDTFDFFARLYKEKTSKELDIPPCCGQKVPSVISETSISAFSGIERAVASSFTTLGARVPNGCSKEFSSSMENYLVENFEKNESFKDFKVKKKWFSEDLLFEWK